MIKTKGILYSGKLWWALNLVNQSSKCIGEFLFWRSRALLHRAIVYEIILVGLKFGDCPQNHQFAKLKTLPKFPTIWYLRCSYTYTRTHLPTQHHEVQLCFHKSLHRFLFLIQWPFIHGRVTVAIDFFFYRRWQLLGCFQNLHRAVKLMHSHDQCGRLMSL